MNKISHKIRELHERFSLLEQLNLEVDYKDFYECHKINIKPLRIRNAMVYKLKEIDVDYRKRFGEELLK